MDRKRERLDTKRNRKVGEMALIILKQGLEGCLGAGSTRTPQGPSKPLQHAWSVSAPGPAIVHNAPRDGLWEAECPGLWLGGGKSSHLRFPQHPAEPPRGDGWCAVHV